MLPGKVETKTLPSRRTKYFIVALFAIIFVLSYNLYKVHREKSDVAKRKGYFIMKYRDTKKELGVSLTDIKMKTSGITLLQKQLEETKKERNDGMNKIDDLNEENDKLRQNLEKLEELAGKSKKDLEELKVEHQDSASQLTTMKDNLQKALDSCQHSKDQTGGLEKALKQKEADLEQCLQNQQKVSQEKQELADENRRVTDALKNNQARSAERETLIEPRQTAVYPYRRTVDGDEGALSRNFGVSAEKIIGRQPTAVPIVLRKTEAVQTEAVRRGSTSKLQNDTSRTAAQVLATRLPQQPDAKTSPVEQNRTTVKPAVGEDNKEPEDVIEGGGEA